MSTPKMDYDTPEEYMPTQDEKNIAMLSHVLTLLAGFIPPLVIFLIKKDESDFIREHALESLNFQITLMIYMTVSIFLMFVVIGFLLIFVVCIAALVLIIVATVRATEGEFYEYPYTLRLIK